MANGIFTMTDQHTESEKKHQITESGKSGIQTFRVFHKSKCFNYSYHVYS